MKRVRSTVCSSLPLFIFLLLLCCGCSAQGPSTSDGGGIGGTGIISRGAITTFGSIFVNGTEFDTRNARIIVKGEDLGVGDEAATANLDVGKVVTVEAMVARPGETGVAAHRVLYRDNVLGPVEAIGEAKDVPLEIVVLGQTVFINDLTMLKGTTIDTLTLNDVVAVSGLIDETGAVRALFIEKTGEFTPGLEVEVTGTMENLDTDRKIFEINDLAVDYSLADTSRLPLGVPAEGVHVEAEGTINTTGGEMLASRVEPAYEFGDRDAEAIELTGFVTEFYSVFEFTVGYQAVRTDAETLFIDGTPEDLALGVKLEAEGHLAEGILVAREVEFWKPDQIEVGGLVRDFVSTFEFTVGNQVVHTDSETVFVGGTPEDIALNVMLEVKGRLEGDVLLADKVSFELA